MLPSYPNSSPFMHYRVSAVAVDGYLDSLEQPAPILAHTLILKRADHAPERAARPGRAASAQHQQSSRSGCGVPVDLTGRVRGQVARIQEISARAGLDMSLVHCCDALQVCNS